MKPRWDGKRESDAEIIHSARDRVDRFEHGETFTVRDADGDPQPYRFRDYLHDLKLVGQ